MKINFNISERFKKIFYGIVIIFFCIFLTYTAIAFQTYDKNRQPKFGITYSKQYAQYLGLDWQQTYIALLDELKVKFVRLPIFWEEVEPKDNQFNFTDVDWLLDQSRARGVKVVLTVGWRQPRWPECHAPEWVKKLPPEERNMQLFDLLATEINRYKNNAEVEIWQVENEPLLNVFGECPNADPVLLKQEIDLVRTIDDRPIMITASGELALWNRESKWGDILGSTLYRITWNKYLGYSSYWMIPSSLYRVKAFIFGHDLNKFWISELQMEPWFPSGKIDVSLDEQFKSMSPDQMVRNYNYANNTNAARNYLWGAEWWYYTKVKLDTEEIWETAKKFDW